MLSYKLDKDFEFIAVQKVFICAAERLFIFRVNTSVIQTYMKIINKVNYSICFAIHISLLWIIIKISLLKIHRHRHTHTLHKLSNDPTQTSLALGRCHLLGIVEQQHPLLTR